MLLLFMLNAAFMMYQLSQVNMYKQIVNSYIESNGKLESTRINQLMVKQHGSEFTVEPASTEDTQDHAFGEKVYYDIKVKISPIANVGPSFTRTVPGVAISEVGQ